MHILLIDNYDSFTYNLAQSLRQCPEVRLTVIRNNRFDPTALDGYDGIVLSPGPGIPSEAGHLLEVVRRYGATKPILGICLGHQAIVEAYGGELYNLPEVYHGVATPIQVAAGEALFRMCLDGCTVGRYHSWAATILPDSLHAIAHDEQGCIMAVRHRSHPVVGLQFHPESVLTPHGDDMVAVWLEEVAAYQDSNVSDIRVETIHEMSLRSVSHNTVATTNH